MPTPNDYPLILYAGDCAPIARTIYDALYNTTEPAKMASESSQESPVDLNYNFSSEIKRLIDGALIIFTVSDDRSFKRSLLRQEIKYIEERIESGALEADSICPITVKREYRHKNRETVEVEYEFGDIDRHGPVINYEGDVDGALISRLLSLIKSRRDSRDATLLQELCSKQRKKLKAFSEDNASNTLASRIGALMLAGGSFPYFYGISDERRPLSGTARETEHQTSIDFLQTVSATDLRILKAYHGIDYDLKIYTQVISNYLGNRPIGSEDNPSALPMEISDRLYAARENEELGRSFEAALRSHLRSGLFPLLQTIEWQTIVHSSKRAFSSTRDLLYLDLDAADPSETPSIRDRFNNPLDFIHRFAAIPTFLENLSSPETLSFASISSSGIKAEFETLLGQRAAFVRLALNYSASLLMLAMYSFWFRREECEQAKPLGWDALGKIELSLTDGVMATMVNTSNQLILFYLNSIADLLASTKRGNSGA